MSLGNTTENAILALILNATAWANYADNAASTPQANIAMSLHTADPGEAGDATTSEIAYTSYARGSVARTTSGWTAPSGGSSNLVATLSFAVGTGGSGTATHFAAEKTGGGAAVLIGSGTVTPNIVTGLGVTPQLSTATAVTMD